MRQRKIVYDYLAGKFIIKTTQVEWRRKGYKKEMPGTEKDPQNSDDEDVPGDLGCLFRNIN
jgi:hypothetical protein